MAYTEEKAFELVKSAHENGRLAHAFLITGNAEAGGTRLAARIIELINAEADTSPAGFDLFGEAPGPAETRTLSELEGDLVRIIRPAMKSRRISVDSMRELEKALHQTSASNKWKVAVILEADRITKEGANAFLKTLEEPPPNCLIILITALPESLLPTVLSRCVIMPLITDQTRDKYEGEDELLENLARLAKTGFGSISRALTIKSAFAKLLDKRKASITKANDAAYKEEILHFKKSTDADQWLKEREKFYIAMAESEYLRERSQFIDILIAWLGDVVRLKSGVTNIDFPKQKNILQQIAETEDISSLLLRMEALESLREALETNVTEALALEVYFMKAFS